MYIQAFLIYKVLYFIDKKTTWSFFFQPPSNSLPELPYFRAENNPDGGFRGSNAMQRTIIWINISI
jgi:hypothetical protein